MGSAEVVTFDIAGFIAIGMSVIGFVTVWIKFGHDKGRQEEVINALKKTTEENKSGISEVRSKTHNLELRIAEFMGEMRVNINDIKETVSELKPKGGSRAAKK